MRPSTERGRVTRGALLGVALAALPLVLAAPAGAKTGTKTIHECVSGSAPLLDRSSSSLSLNVPVPKDGLKPQLGATSALTVGVRATHTADSDLSFVLVPPDGNAYSLAIRRGSSGDGYGSGAASCSGSLVLFSDLFTTPISTPGNTGDNPITGSFKPDYPLFNLTNHTKTFGLWTLLGNDSATDDTGAINAFSLDMTYTYKKSKKKKKK